MPELAELKLTADYINSCSDGIKYVGISQTTNHKGSKIDIPYLFFKMSAVSRGKELIIKINDNDSKNSISIRMTMGMSGHFRLSNSTHEPKHSHIKFHRKDGTTLSFVDVRRFGKWKITDDWSSNRGPDPTLEFDEFKSNIMSNLHKKEFDKQIHLVLMNQRYFNGIGNYLRAEILYSINADPFTKARDYIESHGDRLFELCKQIPELAYVMGGGSIKDWINPFKSELEYPRTKSDFFKCYNQPDMYQTVDKNGRRFWYNPKWQ